MTRRTTRTTHPGAVIRSARGAHGYTGGVTADAVSDPAPTFPSRPVVVPAAAVTPLTAGPDTVTVDSGGVQVVTLHNFDLHGDEFGAPVPLMDLDAATTVLKAWCVVEYPWDNTNDTLIIGYVDQPDSVQGIIYYNLFQPPGYDPESDIAAREPLPVTNTGDPGGYAQSLVALQDTSVVAYAPTSSPASLVHIYLLVATPAT